MTFTHDCGKHTQDVNLHQANPYSDLAKSVNKPYNHVTCYCLDGGIWRQVIKTTWLHLAGQQRSSWRSQWLDLVHCFQSDGQTIASGSFDSSVKLWDATGQCLNTLQGHAGGVWSVAFSPDGQMLASGSDDTSVRLWDIKTGQCLGVAGTL